MVEINYGYYTLKINEQEPLKFNDKNDITIIKDIDFDINLYDENVTSYFEKPKFLPGSKIYYYDEDKLIEVWEIIPHNERSVFNEIKAFIPNYGNDIPIAELDTDNIFESEKDVWYYKIKNYTSEYCKFKLISEEDVEEYIDKSHGQKDIKLNSQDTKIIICNKNQNHTGFLTSFNPNDAGKMLIIMQKKKFTKEAFNFIKTIVYELFHSYFFSKNEAKNYMYINVNYLITCFTRNDNKNDIVNNKILQEILIYLGNRLSNYAINDVITKLSFKNFYDDTKLYYSPVKDKLLFRESKFKLL